MRLPLLAAAMLACTAGPAHAQSVESDVTPESAHLVKDSSEYAVPQVVSDATLQSMQYQDPRDRFSVKFGLVIMPADYTTFDQDADSKAQVGNQQDEFEARSLRLMARGHFELFRKWNYVLSYEYKGFDQSSTADWNATDIKVSTQLGPRLGTLALGRTDSRLYNHFHFNPWTNVEENKERAASRIQHWMPDLYKWINTHGHNHPVDFDFDHGHAHGDMAHHHGDGQVEHTHRKKRRRRK